MGQSQTRAVRKIDSRYIEKQSWKHATCAKCRDFMLEEEFHAFQRVSFSCAAKGREEGCCFCDLLCAVAEQFCSPSTVEFRSLEFGVYASDRDANGLLNEAQPFNIGLEVIRSRDDQCLWLVVKISAPFGITLYHQVSASALQRYCLQESQSNFLKKVYNRL
jgi:hypothetical protein